MLHRKCWPSIRCGGAAAAAASSIRRYTRWDREADYECDDIDIARFAELFPAKKVREEWRQPLFVSRESSKVIQLLRNARNSPARLDKYLARHASRLVCKDLQYVFSAFLKNPDKDIDLAFKVFELMRKESWYKPDASTYMRLISFYCVAERKSKPMGRILELLKLAQSEGVALEEAMFTDPMHCCVQQRDFDTCAEFYELMRSSGCQVQWRFYKYLARNFRAAGFREQSLQSLADSRAQRSPSRLTKRIFFIEDV